MSGSFRRVLRSLGLSKFQRLVSSLRNQAAEVRIRAAQGLYEMNLYDEPVEEALLPLVSCLVDTDPRVREAGANALSRVRGSLLIGKQAGAAVLPWSAADPLLRALNDPDKAVRLQAVSTLGDTMDGRAAGPLLAVLEAAMRETPDPELFEVATFALDRVNPRWPQLPGARGLVAPLTERLVGPNGVDLNAAELLVRIGGQEAAGAIISACSARWEDNAFKTEILRRLPDVLPPRLPEEWTRWAVKALVESFSEFIIQPGEREALVALLDRIDPDWRKSKPAGEALTATLDVLNRTNSPCHPDRLQAFEILATLRDPRAVEPLLAAIRQADRAKFGIPEFQAIDALGELADVRAFPTLISEINRRDSPMCMRTAAARALGRLGDRRAVPPLVALVSSSDPMLLELRQAAAQALGELGDPRALEPLIKSCSSLKGWGIEALGKLGDQRAFDAICREGLRGLHWGSAVEALLRLRHPRTPDALRHAVGKICIAGADEDLLDGIARFGGPSAVEALIEVAPQAIIRGQIASKLTRTMQACLGSLSDEQLKRIASLKDVDESVTIWETGDDPELVTYHITEDYSGARQLAQQEMARRHRGGAPARASQSTITVACECGRRYRVASRAARRSVKCPKCGRSIQIPDRG